MTRAFLVGIVLSLVTQQLAQAADDQAAADALISKGLELRREGRAVDAVDLFQKAVALSPTPRSFGQLGLAESAVEHWSDAEDHLNSALASPQDAWVKRNHNALDLALNLVRAHIGQISLTGPAGAAITVSGRPVGTLPLTKPIRANAGPAIVTATASGFRQFETTLPVEVAKETQFKIILEPVEALPSVPPPPAPRPAPMAAAVPVVPPQQIEPQSSWKTWTGISLLGAGAGLATWGIVWIALDGHHSSSGSCSSGAGPGCVPVYNTKTGGIILTGVGAAAAITGGILLYTNKTHTNEVGLAVGPASLSLAGRF